MLFKYKNLQEEVLYVIITFPENCLLGKRRVHLELFFPIKLVDLSNNEIIITPVLFISLEKHTPFPRSVKTELPILDKSFSVRKISKICCSFRKELTISEQTVTIRALYFSHAAVIKLTTSLSRINVAAVCHMRQLVPSDNSLQIIKRKLVACQIDENTLLDRSLKQSISYPEFTMS